jgi:gluconolactonase
MRHGTPMVKTLDVKLNVKLAVKKGVKMNIEIKKLSSRGGDLFPTNDLRRICSGFLFSEGPVWDIKADCLYFTDFQKFHIWRWTESGGAELYRENSNRAIGLSMDRHGRIVAAESKAHAIAWADHEKSETVVNAFNGKRLNSPNDVVVSRDGFIFFTDPYSQMMGEPMELGFTGIFSVSPQGEIRLVDDTFQRPNGIALSPDESILYVNDSAKQKIFAFHFNGRDGTAGKIGCFAETDVSHGKGVVDGMKVDVEGNVYVTGPGGIWAFSPGGDPAAVLYIPEQVGNFCFGGRDSRTLYITASSSVYTLAAGIPGVVPWRP